MAQQTEENDVEIIQDGDEKSLRVSGVDAKFALARKIIADIKDQLAGLERIMVDSEDIDADDLEQLVRIRRDENGESLSPANEGKILEGVFDGQNMVGSDGRQYIVPPNYSSKSKLVEGDILKLTIQPNGSFIYKQIGPIERQRAMGTLTRDEITNDWRVIAAGRKYAVLTAAVSYHKGKAGDEAVIIIPKAAPSKWAAIENIIKNEG
ncbi:hypothetical protein HZC53_03560 [Candidatus Uhrbacteria bacterium]|nr:hypothetical protein [Candidatus Uhrbacteria bacterium]